MLSIEKRSVSVEFNNIGLHQCQLYLCSALPMSAAATQVVPPSEAWRSFWHHLGAVVTELALNLPLASKAIYLLAPRTGGAPWLFCGPDDWMAGTPSGCLPWDGQRREAVPSCVVLSPCIFLPFTLSLLKLDEDSRKSHYTSWEAVTAEARNECVSNYWSWEFPKSLCFGIANLFEQGLGYATPNCPIMSPELIPERRPHGTSSVSHCVLAQRLRTGTSQKGTCSYTKPGCSPITSDLKISQTGPFLPGVDGVRNLGG